MTSFIVVTSMLIGGLTQWFLTRGIKTTPTEKVAEKQSTFLGFPDSTVATSAVLKLDQKPFNTSCPYCRAKKASWDVSGCTTYTIGNDTQHALVLTCITCASIRLVNPETLGALVPTGEDNALTWLK